MSHPLLLIAWISLALAILSSLIITIDLFAGHRQHMVIMNLVWPITALWAGPLALLLYFRFGRLSTHRAMMKAKANHEPPAAKKKPFWAVSALAATHCGAGCTLGDILAEWAVFFFPPLLAAFGYGSLFAHKIFAAWILDFLLAFLLGILFQYFTIVPMRHLPPLQGLWHALKADTLSLISWQIGMYGWMAIATFVLFGHELEKTSPVFWFMMQIGMIFGFLTAFPVNWLLVRTGVKEKM